jgi:hypothetical protein
MMLNIGLINIDVKKDYNAENTCTAIRYSD